LKPELTPFVRQAEAYSLLIAFNGLTQFSLQVPSSAITQNSAAPWFSNDRASPWRIQQSRPASRMA
jgi:hypothetical protein